MPTVQVIKLIAILLFLPTYAVLGGRVFRRWRRGKPAPNVETDPESWLSYWLPKLIAFELWVLVGTAVVWFVFAFVAPTLHGDNERYFILGGGMAFPLLVLFFVAIDVYAVVRARRMARSNKLLTDR